MLSRPVTITPMSTLSTSMPPDCAEQNGYQIDGAYSNTPSRGGGTSISPNPEIVESMDINTNDFDAQKGRNGGATVYIFTKSGANEFHGSIDYYFLNNPLSARTEFGSTVPPFTRNEVGATFGGPIIKNKFFIFGAIDLLRSSTTSAGHTPSRRRISIPGPQPTSPPISRPRYLPPPRRCLSPPAIF